MRAHHHHEPAVGALAWASLLQAGALDSLPTPELPAPFKNSWARKVRRAQSTEHANLLGVLPNPASDRIAFTYPEGMEQGRIEVFNAQGQLVQSIALNGRAGLLESSVSALENGLYSASIVVDGFKLSSTKFNVMR